MSLLAFSRGVRARHVVLDGDSITIGGVYVPTDTSGTQLMTLLPPGVTHTNVAVGGHGADACPHAGWDSGLDLRNVIYYLDAAINNLNSGGPSAATIYGYIETAIADAKAAGVLATVVGTIIASTAHDVGQGRLADRLALNDMLRAGKGGADRLVDYADDAFFQDPDNYGPEGDGTGDGDTHPGVLGTLRMMEALAAVINAGLL